MMNDFWSMSGNFKNRHHVEPRVKLYSPREESFPIPPKYVDVSRTTHTNLDVMQERRIDDYGTSMGEEIFLIHGQVSLNLLYWKRTSKRIHVVRGRLTRQQLTSRPDHLWPEVWEKLGRSAKLKERQKWSHEKPKLDNARKL